MRIKDGFMLREIAGSWVVVPVGQRVVDFNGIISLSESGALIWSKLEKGIEDMEEVVSLLKENYSVDDTVVREDIKEFLNYVKERGLMEDGSELGAAECKIYDRILSE